MKDNELKNQALRRMQMAKSMPAGGRGAPARQQATQTSFSPDYQKSKYAQRDAGLTGNNSAPSFSAPGFKGKAKKARIHSQRVQYDRERRKASDAMNLEGMRQTGQTGRVAMREAGASQRQRSGFVQALQEQQNRFGQQNKLQEGRFGQQSQQQQNRFGQQSALQEGRFGQQNQLEQTRQEGQRRQSALDYRTAGGSVAGAATINNGGYTDYGNIQPIQSDPKTGTHRFFQDDMDKWYSGDTRTGAASPLSLGERLTPRP